MGGIQTIEVVQLGSALLGVIVSLYGIAYAQRDIWRLSEDDDATRIDDVTGRIRRRRCTMRLLKHAGMLLGGWIITNWRLHNESWLEHIAESFGAHDYTSLLSYYTARFTLTYVSVLTMIETLFERHDRYIVGRMSDVELRRAGIESELHALRQDRRRTDPNRPVLVDSDHTDAATGDDAAPDSPA